MSKEKHEADTIGERIHTLVDHYCKGNISAFARSISVSPQAVRDLIKGEKGGPSWPVLQKLLAAYPGLETEWVIFGKGPMLRGQAAEASLPASPTGYPSAGGPGLGIRTRLRYSCTLPEQGNRKQQSFSLEIIRYLPYRLKKKHQVLEEAEGDYIKIADIMLNTEREEHWVYFETQLVESEQRLAELREKLVAKGWVEEGMLDCPEQFKYLATGEPNPVYDPRFG